MKISWNTQFYLFLFTQSLHATDAKKNASKKSLNSYSWAFVSIVLVTLNIFVYFEQKYNLLPLAY